MFSALTRFFQAGPSNDDNDAPDRGKQRAVGGPTESAGVTITVSHSSSSVNMEHVRQDGPSQVTWITPSPASNGSGSLPNFSWYNRGTNASSGGASTPNSALALEPTTPRRGFFATRSKPSLRRMSSQSLHLQSMYLSERSETSSVSSILPNKPLSPIDEQQRQFPPERRPSIESIPLSPDSTKATDSYAPSINSASHPAFLTRPLKRSISQTSANTFLSTASHAAPTIPPLDLKPTFPTGTLGLPPRKSHLAQPSLPTVLGSPRPNVSVIYEDSVSFRTAASGEATTRTRSDEEETEIVDYDYEVEDGEGEVRESYPVEYFPSSTAGSARESLNTIATMEQQDEQLRPSDGLYEVDITSPINSTSNGSIPHAYPPSHTHLVAEPVYPSPYLASDIASSFQTSSSRTTAVESAIKRRWLKGISFGSDRFIWASGSKQPPRITSACVLFWVGFIAPWCWLIGGWYLSRSGEMDPEGQYVETVTPQWPRKRTKSAGSGTLLGVSQPESAVDDVRKPDGKSKRTTGIGLMKFWRALFARSWESSSSPAIAMKRQSPNSLPPHVQSAHGHSTTKGQDEEVGMDVLDPWVARCRIAAVISGAILTVAVVVALIVISGLHTTKLTS